MTFNLAIIDMDPLVYRCGFSIQKYNKELEVLEVEPIKHAFYNVNSMMRKVFNRTECENYQGFLSSSGKDNFRYGVYPDYKINRAGKERPVHYEEIRNYMQKRWNGVVTEAQEADDACSIAQCRAHPLGWGEDLKHTVVCSFDKDFNNIPGWHYNYLNDQLYYVTEIEAYRNFYLQILTGDTSDDIPRIKKGWRQKEAELQIKKCNCVEELEKVVFDHIVKVRHNELVKLTQQERCAIIEEITWRGQLTWLRRKPKEMWLPKMSSEIVLKC